MLGDFLVSFCGTVWLPDEPMKGLGIDTDNTHGVHAFRELSQAQLYGTGGEHAIAVGVVKLWGTIIEHEQGYRGEFAKPARLLSVHRFAGPTADGVLAALNRRYRLEDANGA